MERLRDFKAITPKDISKIFDLIQFFVSGLDRLYTKKQFTDSFT